MSDGRERKRRPTRTRPPEDRFWDKVHTEPNTGCWMWMGAQDRAGYARFGWGGDQGTGFGHRWAYEHYIGPIPDGLVLDHLCRNTSCVCPYHLEPVTIWENVRRGDSAASRPTCKRGHPKVAGQPNCRECRRIRRRASAEAARALKNPVRVSCGLQGALKRWGTLPPGLSELITTKPRRKKEKTTEGSDHV